MAILDFSVSGWHGFGSLTQVCFGISVSNFMCMSFVAVGKSLTIVRYVTFKMAALWFWTMFNCNPPIAQCHPLLWGGGILVDHWSTISSFISSYLISLPTSITLVTLGRLTAVSLHEREVMREEVKTRPHLDWSRLVQLPTLDMERDDTNSKPFARSVFLQLIFARTLNSELRFTKNIWETYLRGDVRF